MTSLKEQRKRSVCLERWGWGIRDRLAVLADASSPALITLSICCHIYSTCKTWSWVHLLIAFGFAWSTLCWTHTWGSALNKKKEKKEKEEKERKRILGLSVNKVCCWVLLSIYKKTLCLLTTISCQWCWFCSHDDIIWSLSSTPIIAPRKAFNSAAVTAFHKAGSFYWARRLWGAHL